MNVNAAPAPQADDGPLPLKPHLTVEQQLTQLKQRGLTVADEAAALRELARLGYYRLSGYYYPLRRTNPSGKPGRQDTFVEGATFELIVQLADFDKRLRLLALDALETVEVAVRVAIAHRLGKFNATAHLSPKALDTKFTQPYRGAEAAYNEWLRRFNTACQKSKEDFRKHHLERYGGAMPIWVAVELWDFGLLSKFYAGMQQRDRDAIATLFAPVDGPVFVNWMKMFNFVRNVSAHHSRLWNRTLPDVAKLPPLERCRHLQPLHDDEAVRHKLFAAFTCLRLLLKRIHPQSTWHTRVKEHLATFPSGELLSLSSAGFEPGWQERQIWL
jgi:abortive infection bacteriophage resistance protein